MINLSSNASRNFIRLFNGCLKTTKALDTAFFLNKFKFFFRTIVHKLIIIWFIGIFGFVEEI